MYVLVVMYKIIHFHWIKNKFCQFFIIWPVVKFCEVHAYDIYDIYCSGLPSRHNNLIRFKNCNSMNKVTVI